MSLYEYQQSTTIDAEDYDFYALLMALMRKADDNNLQKLSSLFPETYKELKERYNAPRGIINE